MGKSKAQHEAEYNARTKVQFNTFEIHNLLHGYRYYLHKNSGIRSQKNSLTIKLEKALKRCEDKAGSEK